MKTCKLNDCDRIHYGKGYCHKHYMQVWKHGKLTGDRPIYKGKSCSVTDCEADAYCRGYCIKHYQQVRAHGEIQPDTPNNTELKCSVRGCRSSRYSGEYCCRHYHQVKRHGKVLKITCRDKNEHVELDDRIEFYLRDKNMQPCATVIIDKDDAGALDYVWSLAIDKYASATIDGKRVYLHRWLMPDAEMVDHANGDTFDNRRSNLREVTPQQSACNTGPRGSSGVKGVSLHRASGRWFAYVGRNGKRYSAGYHDTIEEAAEARKHLALKLQGEYAYEARS